MNSPLAGSRIGRLVRGGPEAGSDRSGARGPPRPCPGALTRRPGAAAQSVRGFQVESSPWHSCGSSGLGGSRACLTRAGSGARGLEPHRQFQQKGPLVGLGPHPPTSPGLGPRLPTALIGKPTLLEAWPPSPFLPTVTAAPRAACPAPGTWPHGEGALIQLGSHAPP